MKKEWLIKTLTMGIVVLFIGTGVVSAFNINSVNKSKPVSNGNWFYVGGSGPGNYSNIQDAIDNATDGDTVFVYDDSSPYFEIITTDKSITMQGENMTTTIIGQDPWGEDDYVTISSDYVTIAGFTFNGSKSGGIWCEDVSNIIIEHCVFYSNAWGIALRGKVENTIIQNCSFLSSHVSGIQFSGFKIKNNEVSYCDFIDNGDEDMDFFSGTGAIHIWPAQSLKIHHCNIVNNWRGIVLQGLIIKNVDISFNNIFNNYNNWDHVGVFFKTYPLLNYARHNWWGTPQGPNIYMGDKIIRDVDGNETILFNRIGLFVGFFHIFPWLSEPVADAGQQT